MNKRTNWQKFVALTLFLMLLGGYYQQFSVETKTMVLPMGIIIVAAMVIARFKQLDHEVRSLKVTAFGIAVQNVSVIDNQGRERVAIITDDENNALITCYDESHTARYTLELLDQEPELKLEGQKGSACITFGQDGRPNFIIKDDAGEIIWSAL